MLMVLSDDKSVSSTHNMEMNSVRQWIYVYIQMGKVWYFKDLIK